MTVNIIKMLSMKITGIKIRFVPYFYHMSTAFKFYKRRFRNALQPLFVMLIHRKPEMDVWEWQNFVKQTMGRVKENPYDFLGADLPERSLLASIVDDIFTEFLKLKGRR